MNSTGKSDIRHSGEPGRKNTGRDSGKRPFRNNRDKSSRQERGSSASRTPIAELKNIDRDILRLIVRRVRLAENVGNVSAPEIERELRASWEKHVASISRDPRLVHRFFALLQELEISSDADSSFAFNLAPSGKIVKISAPLPANDRLARLNLALAASTDRSAFVPDVPLSDAVMQCLKGFAQAGIPMHRDDDGTVTVRSMNRRSGDVFDRVVYVGSDPLNLYLQIFILAGRLSRVKIMGEKDLRFLDLSALEQFLPSLGSRLMPVIPGQKGVPVRLEASAMLPDQIILPENLSEDMILALCAALPSWHKTCTIDMSRHPDCSKLLREAEQLLKNAGQNAFAENSVLRFAPGAELVFTNCDCCANPAACATLLAIPAFTGGKTVLSGVRSEHNLEEIASLLRQCGIVLTLQNNQYIADCDSPSPQKAPLDLHDLSSNLLPIGLVLALRRLLTDPVPIRLPENADRALINDFLTRFGLELNGDTPTSAETNSTPWTAPSPEWALALSLGAFLKPNLKLTNPGIVQAVLPWYWTLYNTLPNPKPLRPDISSDSTQQEKPKRRRILAKYTPESEMPDEIVYPEDEKFRISFHNHNHQ
ncbi:MAG: hypothetical protein PUB69_04915 [Desulfovibrionaceae bacterium]|nr:hypothetical protein [Desulfovibrionaceae bacterium]